jgi:hypothetical protein
MKIIHFGAPEQPKQNCPSDYTIHPVRQNIQKQFFQMEGGHDFVH